MGEQHTASLSPLERAPLARYAGVLILVVVATLLLWTSWNDAGASTSLLHHRIFLIGVALVWAMVAVTLVLVPWSEEVRARLLIAHLLIMGLYIGLAIATTDWSHWQLRGWWQGWWAFPLLAAQVQQVLKLRAGTLS